MMKTSVAKLNLKMACCWLLLLQMVNLSINPIRHQNYINGIYTFKEDLSINKIESIYELIAEYVFKKNVPETQDTGEEGISKIAILFFQTPTVNYSFTPTAKLVVHNHSYSEHVPEFVAVLESPPPQV